MTREEAIKMLRGMKADNLNLNDLYTRDKYEALVMAIKALEQEPIDCKAQYERFSKKAEIVISQLRADRDRLLDVLDKIRTEIAQITSRYSISRERGEMGQVEWSDNLIKESEVLKILDKYKAESEDK